VIALAESLAALAAMRVPLLLLELAVMLSFGTAAGRASPRPTQASTSPARTCSMRATTPSRKLRLKKTGQPVTRCSAPAFPVVFGDAE
jgi:hypothetical protein